MKTVLSMLIACSTMFLLSYPILAGETRTNSHRGWTTTRERTVAPNTTNGYSGSDTVTRTNAQGGQIIIERNWRTDGAGNVEYDSNRTRTTRKGQSVESSHQGKTKFQ